MAVVLVIFWEKKPAGGNLCHMVFDEASGGVLSLPAVVQFSNSTNVSPTTSPVFTNAGQYNPTQLEYKVLQHGTPATNIGRYLQQPHQLSVDVLNAVTSQARGAGIHLRQQFRKKLSGSALTKFKSALIKLGLVQSGAGYAWQVHLWSVALHASTQNHQKVLRSFWSKLTQISVRKKAGKMQFQSWYASL